MVKFVGLGGGIGAGKSTVGTALAKRGAVIIDVDRLSREIQRPGSPVFDAIVDRWGPAVVGPDGQLDRPALGRIVFADSAELAVLTNEITAPAISRAIVERASAHLGTTTVVVLESASLLGGPRRLYGLEGLIAVDVPTEIALTRLVERRGMTEDDARARIGKQRTREERLAAADFVIDNSGDHAALAPRLDQAWTWIRGLPDATPTLDGADWATG